jgi:hypothetical protein
MSLNDSSLGIPFEGMMEDQDLQLAFYDGLMFYKGSEILLKCMNYKLENQMCSEIKVKRKKEERIKFFFFHNKINKNINHKREKKIKLVSICY